MSNEENKNQNKIFGFRSGKLYKKIISTAYFVLAVITSLLFLLTIESTLDALVAAEVTVSLFVPYIFLSDFKFREKIPLFKKHKAGYSFLGLICVYVIINVFFTLINPGFYK